MHVISRHGTNMGEELSLAKEIWSFEQTRKTFLGEVGLPSCFDKRFPGDYRDEGPGHCRCFVLVVSGRFLTGVSVFRGNLFF